VPQNILPALSKSDNQGAIALTKNPVKHSRSKNIDIRFHFIRECYKENIVSVDYVSSAYKIADIFTKPAKKNIFKYFGQYFFRTWTNNDKLGVSDMTLLFHSIVLLSKTH